MKTNLAMPVPLIQFNEIFIKSFKLLLLISIVVVKLYARKLCTSNSSPFTNVVVFSMPLFKQFLMEYGCVTFPMSPDKTEGWQKHSVDARENVNPAKQLGAYLKSDKH